jgi:hypothetical protein
VIHPVPRNRHAARLADDKWLRYASMPMKKLNPPSPKSILGKKGKKTITWTKYEALLYSTFGTDDYKRLQGPSPGGAAVDLDMSRQAVHRAIERGSLDAWYVYDGKIPGLRQLRMINVTMESIERYKASGRRRA